MSTTKVVIYFMVMKDTNFLNLLLLHRDNKSCYLIKQQVHTSSVIIWAVFKKTNLFVSFKGHSNSTCQNSKQMNTKYLIAGLLGAVASNLLGWLIYGTLLSSMIAEASMPGFQKPIMEFHWPFMILSNLASGFFIAYIFSRWAHITTFASGLTAGATIGLFMGMIYDFVFYATTNMMTMQGYLLDIVSTIVITAIVGGIVGWWLGRGK